MPNLLGLKTEEEIGLSEFEGFLRAEIYFTEKLTEKTKFNVKYIEFDENIKTKLSSYSEIYMYDPIDHSIAKEMKTKFKTKLNILESKLFILTNSEIDEYMSHTKSPYFNATFYKWVRQKKDILMNGGKPIGGSWSFDVENRLPFPKDYKEKEIKFY